MLLRFESNYNMRALINGIQVKSKNPVACISVRFEVELVRPIGRRSGERWNIGPSGVEELSLDWQSCVRSPLRATQPPMAVNS